MRRYYVVFTALSLFLAIGIILINMLIDPYASFRLLDIKGLNHVKLDQGSRLAKSLALSRGSYDTVILGTSRPEVGFRTDHPGWKGARVYNAGLSGSNMYETYRVFEYLADHHLVNRVLLSLDFLMFTDARTVNADFDISLFNKDSSSVDAFFRSTLSWPALKQSIKTVKVNRRGGAVTYRHGQLLGEYVFPARIKRHGQVQWVWDELKFNFMQNRATYLGYHYDPGRVQMLRKIALRCRQDGIELLVVIPPVHALQLQTIYLMGLGPVFEKWKRDVVTVLSDDEGMLAPVYDFAHWSPYTTEEFVRAGKLHWFWETCHFKQALGDLVLNRVLLHQKAPDHFGERLTRENIERHLQVADRLHSQYVHQYPEDIAALQDVFEKTE